MPSTRDLPLESLGLPTRPFNALSRADVRTMTDLLALSAESLASIRALGTKSLAQIRRTLDDYTDQFAPSADWSPAVDRTAIGVLGVSANLETELEALGLCTLSDLERASLPQLTDIMGARMAGAILMRASAYRLHRLFRTADHDQQCSIQADGTGAPRTGSGQAQGEHVRSPGMDISSLGLSARAHNALKRAGICSVEMLMTMNADEIRGVRNVGSRALAEILEAMDRVGHFVHAANETQEPTVSQPKLVRELDLPLSVRKKLARARVVTIKDLSGFSQERLLAELAIRWEGVCAIEGTLEGIGLRLAEDGPQSPVVGHDLAGLAEQKEVPLNQIRLERLVLPRAWNRLLREAGVGTVGQLCQASEVVLAVRLPGGKCRIAQIRRRVRDYVAWLVEQECWSSEVLQQGLSPVFRIELARASLHETLERLLSCLESGRDRLIVRERWGLDQTEQKTLEEVGELIGVTRERVRQVQARAMRQIRHPSNRRTIGLLLELLAETVALKGGVATTGYLAESLSSHVDCLGANVPNMVRFLCSIDGRFVSVTNDLWGLEGYPLHRVQEINRAMLDILEERHGFAAKAEILREFSSTELRRELENDVAQEFLEACLDSNPRIEISSDGRCALSTVTTERVYSMVQALRSAGRPLHYSEVAREANRLLREDRHASPHVMHAHMGRLPDIFVRCGHGVFGLAEWGLPHDRSLSDAAHRVLTELAKPAHLEWITDKVLETWQVERASVHAAVQSDERFCRVGEGVYWLRDRIAQGEAKRGEGAGFSEVYGAALLQRQEMLEQWQAQESADTHNEVEKIRRMGASLFDSKESSR